MPSSSHGPLSPADSPTYSLKRSILSSGFVRREDVEEAKRELATLMVQWCDECPNCSPAKGHCGCCMKGRAL